jgi:hypothetical protein
MCNNSHEGHKSSEANQESTLVPTKNYFWVVSYDLSSNIFSSVLTVAHHQNTELNPEK